MYNFSLLVAVIAGMVVLDIVIETYVKSWKDVLGEIACAILLVIMAYLLSLEDVTKQIGDNFVLWCLAILALAIILIMVGVHFTMVIGADRKQKNNDEKKKTPVKKVNK